MIITTRSQNDELYQMASSFFLGHIERRQMNGYDHWSDALRTDIINQKKLAVK
jgi:hypothetical protein